MRLWTVHPKYLDAQGLVALWREGLLAQAVLAGRTKGYRRHPQLVRFLAHSDPLSLIAAYLRPIHDEAQARGYSFDGSKITGAPARAKVSENEGQLMFEWNHLLAKLKKRSPNTWRRWNGLAIPEAHPLFRIVPGPKQEWEKG